MSVMAAPSESCLSCPRRLCARDIEEPEGAPGGAYRRPVRPGQFPPCETVAVLFEPAWVMVEIAPVPVWVTSAKFIVPDWVM